MKNKIIKLMLFSLISVSLVSCDDSKTDEEILNEYDVSQGEVLKDQKVYQTSLAFSVNAFEDFTIDVLDWHWDYDLSPLFIKDDSKMSKEELGAFARVYKYNDHFEDVKYKCEGTDFYSYTEKIKGDGAKYNIKMPDSGIYTPYLVCDLQEYTIAVKDSNESFKIYGATGDGPHIELIKQDE